MQREFDSYHVPDLQLPPGDLWVFGYGSVMWRPGFPHRERHKARVHGYHRALCVWSWAHRGTQARPGLVLGLDAGGSCLGMVFRVDAADKDAVADYLYSRELVVPGYPYRAVLLPLSVAGQAVRALSFVVDRKHPQYAGKLAPEAAARTVRHAVGKSGANTDYVASTVRHLDDLGIAESPLHRVHALLQADPAD
jgi:cation transport protein ChaC